MAKIKVQARFLQPGDVTGSGEVVRSVSSGIGTPRGKVDVALIHGSTPRIRKAIWGAYTEISVERADAKETTTLDHSYEPGAFGVCRRCGSEKH
jgi:hypothetical protein